MVNLKVFDKKHPNSEQNRACVRSKDLLARIDKINVSGGTEKEISEVESLLRMPALVFPAPYLLCDLYNTTGIGKTTILKAEPEKPIKENTKKPNNPVPPTNPDANSENENPDAGKDDGDENPTVSPAESETPAETTQPVETPDEQKSEENTMKTETPDENPTVSPAESETSTETTQPVETPDEPQSEENTMKTEAPDENPTETPAESETPTEDTTEAPAETAQPKAKRGRKKAEDAAE